MSSVEPGDWFQSKGNPSAFLEVVAVWTEAGEEQVKVRIGKQERDCSKRYLLATWVHLEDDEPRKEEPWRETAHRSGSTSGTTTTSEP